MTELYFGASENPLYGVYHPPHIRVPRAPAVLLCNPFGIEAIRAFRIYRNLAEKLAQAGSPVLRFDYYGTGDSSGECEDFCLSRGVEDILTAHQELIDMSGANRIVWLGLRMGGLLALRASQERPKGLFGITLWDPVLDGAAYLQELQSAHVQELMRVFDLSEKNILNTRAPDELSHQALGFALSETLVLELTKATSDSIEQRPARALALISGERDPATEAAMASFSELGSKTHLHHDPNSQDWNSDAALNAFIVPVKTLALITEAIGGLR